MSFTAIVLLGIAIEHQTDAAVNGLLPFGG
jgi:hypothetical protein